MLLSALMVIRAALEDVFAQLVQLHEPFLLVLQVLHPHQVVRKTRIVEALQGSNIYYN